jgi:energy-coupling factor transport system substrate-specific component
VLKTQLQISSIIHLPAPITLALTPCPFPPFPAIILGLASLLGLTAFLSPFFGNPEQGASMGMAHGNDALLMLSLLSILALASVVASIQSGQMSSKTLAILGALAAVGAVLRFLPGPAGFSALFFLPILAGYAFGSQFGFLSGLTTLLASAFLTGGVGPWLPYQMFAAGWIGAAAGLLPHPKNNSRRELLLLAATGLILGLLYGVVMNLWFWPFVFQPAQSEMYWEPGTGIGSALQRYGLFYLTTSFVWDLWRGIGNAALILLFGAPVLRLLRRYERRFKFVQG